MLSFTKRLGRSIKSLFTDNDCQDNDHNDGNLLQSEEDAREDAWRYYFLCKENKKYRRILLDTAARELPKGAKIPKSLEENEEVKFFIKRMKAALTDPNNEETLKGQSSYISHTEMKIGAGLHSVLDTGDGNLVPIVERVFPWVTDIEKTEKKPDTPDDK